MAVLALARKPPLSLELCNLLNTCSHKRLFDKDKNCHSSSPWLHFNTFNAKTLELLEDEGEHAMISIRGIP